MACNHSRTCADCVGEDEKQDKTIAELRWYQQLLTDMLDDVKHPALVDAPLKMHENGMDGFVDRVMQHNVVKRFEGITDCDTCEDVKDELIYLPCGHVTCAPCMRQLQGFECPVCKARISFVFRVDTRAARAE